MDPTAPVSGVRPGPCPRVDGQCRGLMLVAIVLVVVFHLSWLTAALRPMSSPDISSSIRTSTPMVEYLGSSESSSSPAGDVRRIRSPVLFALPTRVGFSAPLLEDAGGLGPPAMIKDEDPHIRSLNQPFAASPFGASSRDLAQLISMPRPQPVPEPFAEAESPLPAGNVFSNMFMVYWQDRPDQPLEAIPAAGAEVWAGKSAWSMALYVCFDPDGLIRQVMVEKPSPYEDVTAAVLRIARGMAFGAPMFGDCGRLVVVYTPAEQKVE